MATINKISLNDFAKIHAERHGISIAEAKREISGVFGTLEYVLNAKHSFTIPNIGSFKVSDVNETTVTINFGENKGKKKVVPAHKKLTFSASANLRYLYKNSTADSSNG